MNKPTGKRISVYLTDDQYALLDKARHVQRTNFGEFVTFSQLLAYLLENHAIELHWAVIHYPPLRNAARSVSNLRLIFSVISHRLETRILSVAEKQELRDRLFEASHYVGFYQTRLEREFEKVKEFLALSKARRTEWESEEKFTEVINTLDHLNNRFVELAEELKDVPF